LRYDRREDRLILVLPKPEAPANRFFITRRMWLQWVRAMGDVVTEKTLSAPPLKSSAKPAGDEDGATILVDGIRLRKMGAEKYRIGLVYDKSVINFQMSNAELTRLLSVLVGLGKGAGWDLDSALSRLGPSKTSAAPPAVAN
jgi:hypothetical protein